MKKLICTTILAVLLTGGTAMRAQDMPDEYLGLPGDNLNLYAVMNLFQESETLEGFERKLNDENSRINNLDLNGDNLIDYITVSDYVDGNVHTIVLRAILTRHEKQDVAVFTVEQFRNGQAHIQLIGDEALYGKNYIIEPNYAETPNPGYGRPPANKPNVTVVTTSYNDIAAWPLVQFIFLPSYIAWHSAWYWGYYPSFWNPWRPYYWHYYYGYHYNWYPHYYGHFHHSHYHHYAHYQDHYYNHMREHSPMVSERIHNGHYRNTYSRPEQRREGEALYARTASSRNTRPQGLTSTNGQRTRTTAQPAQSPRTGNTVAGNTRRPNEGTYTTRPNSTTRQYAAPASRPSTTATGRTSTTAPSTQRGTTTGRTSNPATGRTYTTAPSTQRATTTGRAGTPATGRTYTTTPSTQRGTATSRSSAPAVGNTQSSNRQVAAPQRSTSSTYGNTSTRPSVSKQSTPSHSSSPAVSRQSTSRPAPAVQRSAPARSSGSSVSSSRTTSHSSSPAGRSATPVSRSSSARPSNR